MACIDCLDNCPDPVLDKCVKYTGEEIPLLDICPGDSLSKFEEAVVEKLLSALDGTGVTPSEITLENCAYLKTLLGTKDPTLGNLLQLLIDSQCSLKALVDTLIPDSVSFDTSCLSGLPPNPDMNDIVQAIIILLCAIKLTVDALPTTYVKLTDLTTLVQQIIASNTSSTQYKDKLVPYTAVPYFGPLSNFDSNGKGLVSSGFDKVYLCNGLNGTPDIRGRVVAGAVQNVPGAALDSAVDPTNALNPNTNYALNAKFGENYHNLVISEIPSHNHTVTDPGHSHQIGMFRNDSRGGDQQDTAYLAPNTGAAPATVTTQNSTTGIAINSTGGGQPHNIRQPSIACYFIMYIP